MKLDNKKDEEQEVVVPESRWHNVELEWKGKMYRFSMSIFDHDEFIPATKEDISLSRMYRANLKNDEWVEVFGAKRDEAWADQSLVEDLVSKVCELEKARIVRDSMEGIDDACIPSEEELEVIQ